MIVLSLNVVAPVVVTPDVCEVPGASVVRLDNAVLPPTTPFKKVAPPVFTLRDCAPSRTPFTVLPSVIVPALLLVSVVLSASVTGSLNVCAPVVVTAPPLIAVVPTASVVIVLNGVVL